VSDTRAEAGPRNRVPVLPTAIDSLPKTNSQIFDRRNQMEGNVSLQQSLEFVEFCNLLLREKAVSDEVLDRIGFTRRQPIAVRFVRMSPELQSTLDYVSKLSREPSHIYRLIDDGVKQGRAFLESLPVKDDVGGAARGPETDPSAPNVRPSASEAA